MAIEVEALDCNFSIWTLFSEKLQNYSLLGRESVPLSPLRRLQGKRKGDSRISSDREGESNTLNGVSNAFLSLTPRLGIYATAANFSLIQLGICSNDSSF